ncbi:MAG: hypothetical protein KDE04_23900, partial [Anaerolineales bacterium]|nr:hypothetical protein [Anaerolineales bacterium]
MSTVRQVLRTAADVIQSDEFEQFRINAQDFLSANDSDGGTPATQLAQMASSLADAAQVINRSHPKGSADDRTAATVISPVVLPKDQRNYFWVVVFLGGLFAGIVGWGLLGVIWEGAWALLLPFFLMLFAYAIYSFLKGAYVMIPDGCQALITKYGKVEATVPAGGYWIFHPRKRVSYIVNTTKEYPYNAPIRKAPTQERVEASVDLFLQFRIEDPSKFIFELGGVNGFSEKLQNVISEVTRALIYEQRADEIYDLVGESTNTMLETLNAQFLPAVRFTSTNITHAEPSNQEYRMDLAAPEIVSVAKEAYTYEYELSVRKEQDEGELNKELASLRQQLSKIQAEVATYQAQIDTAYERAINQAEAFSTRLMVEARSGAKANAALLEAQALDIRALNVAQYPEILEYRYQLGVLDKLVEAAEKLPQVVNVGAGEANKIDYVAIARQMMGLKDDSLYTEADLAAIRGRLKEIAARVKERHQLIKEIEAADNA